MASKTKQSKERIEKAESIIWEGIQKAMNETNDELTAVEVNDILIRYAYQFNKRNLDYNNTFEEDKDVKQINGKKKK